MADGWVVVGVYRTELEAGLARDILEANGIDARVRADGSAAGYPALQFSQGVRLSVPAEDEDAARELLAPVEEAD